MLSLLRFVAVAGLAICISIFASISAIAVPEQCKPNGCGPSGWLGKLVVDQTYFTNCKFKAACDAHDICYGRCIDGCEFHGTDKCKGTGYCLFNSFKYQCDDKLYADITAMNAGNRACEGFAFAYSGAVKLAGCLFYEGQTAAATARFKANFEAFMSYYKSAQDKNLDLKKPEIDKLIELMGRTGVNDDNVFRFTPENGVPSLSVEAIQPLSAPSFLPPSGGINKRTINGIDTTKMRYGAVPFDLRDAMKADKNLDIKGLNQIDRLSIPQQ